MFHRNLVYENLETNFGRVPLLQKKHNAKTNNLHANPEDPWWSMHGIFTYGSSSHKIQPNVGKYTIHHRSSGKWSRTSQQKKSWNRSESRSWNALVLAQFISHTIQASPIVVQDGQPQQKRYLKKQRWRCLFFISDTSSKMVIQIPDLWNFHDFCDSIWIQLSKICSNFIIYKPFCIQTATGDLRSVGETNKSLTGRSSCSVETLKMWMFLQLAGNFLQ